MSGRNSTQQRMLRSALTSGRAALDPLPQGCRRTGSCRGPMSITLDITNVKRTQITDSCSFLFIPAFCPGAGPFLLALPRGLLPHTGKQGGLEAPENERCVVWTPPHEPPVSGILCE